MWRPLSQVRQGRCDQHSHKLGISARTPSIKDRTSFFSFFLSSISLWSFCVEVYLRKCFYQLFIYVYITVGIPIIKRGGLELKKNRFTLPHFARVSRQDRYFQRHVHFFFMFNDLRSEVIVRFDDIGGIVDHHCSNFLC